MTDRRGTPSPLPFYLSAAVTAHAQTVATAMQAATPQALDQADAALHSLRLMVTGIEAWQSSSYEHTPMPRSTIWELGHARLLDGGGDGEVTLIIPSLINRSYILDLIPGTSFLDAMRTNGIRPILLDWGTPTPQSNAMDLSDHVTQILVPALYYLSGMAGGPVHLLGYCLGGSLAVGLAQTAPQAVARVATIGAPWQFEHLTGTAALLRRHIQQTGPDVFRRALRQAGQTYGAVPAELFQVLFALLAPMQASQKFSRFAQMPKDTPEATLFWAIETWVNDSLPVSAAVAEELLIDWYCEDATSQGRWTANGAPVSLANLAHPLLSVRGASDHIVPAPVAISAHDLSPSCRDLNIDAGHVGMIAGKAHAEVAYRVCAFLTQKNIS